MGNVFKRDLQDSSEYNTLVHRISDSSYNLLNSYVDDETEMFRTLDEIAANVQQLRELLGEPKEDKPDNIDASPFMRISGQIEQELGEQEKSDISVQPVISSISDYRAVRVNGTFIEKGDVLAARAARSGNWTFESITHPRKLNVYQDEDPNEEPIWPNRSRREFYASVFSVGIWDVRQKAWTFEPDWSEQTTREVEYLLING